MSEELIRAVAGRYGFRPRDFSWTWGDEQTPALSPMQELVIKTADGRRAVARVEREALRRKDTWKYVSAVDSAFQALSRRHETRGI